MGMKGLLISLVVLALAIGGGLYHDHMTGFTGLVPHLPPDWWGEGLAGKDDVSVKPFKIDFPKELLDDLSQRLKTVRPFHPPLEGIGFEYGFNTKFLETVLDFWKTKYSWKDRQNYLNSFPQFTTQVQGLKIHFIHAKPAKTSGVKVVPLLLLHGWPGSVREFYEMIPQLTAPRPGQDFVFEVIAPSLPGYGFSQAPSRPGMGPAQVAVVMHSLMSQLGHEQYFVQGGDWGALIGNIISQLYPQSVTGFHTNLLAMMPSSRVVIRLLIGSYFPNWICTEVEKDLVYPMSNVFTFMIEETGYLHIQATKPDTVGIALRESPIGLAAYIIEKFSTWTNREWKSLPDGGLLKKFKMENLLDNIMIYWLTGSITSSMRLYSENFSRKHSALGFDQAPVTVPTGYARFHNELATLPVSVLKLKYKNLVQVSDFPTGGHFAAFEEPKLLADDVWKFVNTVLHPKDTKTTH